MQELPDNITEGLARYTDTAVELSMAYGPKLLLAILTLILGLWLIRMVHRGIDKAMDSAKVEPTLQRFLLSLANVVMKGVLFVSVITMIGVETTSIIAMLGAAGLAIGLALQGSLANFAGGVLILFFKPFKLGDVIEAQGYTGIVHEIQIFNTILRTLDNQQVIIPNGLLSNNCIKNLFAEDTRRVDMKFGVSYGDDVAHVRSVLEGVIAKDPRILKAPAHDIFLAEHADSSINFIVRVWVDSDDYWPVYFGMYEAVKLAFDAQGVTIPFPQRDVHMIPVAAATGA
jgi:small conductance mechanosensitive channel